MNNAKMYNIFNTKSKSIKKVECDDIDDEVEVDEPAELPEQIKCDLLMLIFCWILEL